MARAVRCLCIFLWVPWLPLASASSPELHCVSTKSTGFKFSLLSSRNGTGHWTTQVQLKHGAEENETGPWELDVDHTTVTCEDSETVVITATVTGPPQRLHRQDYQLLPRHGYYKVQTAAKTWNDALWTCLSEGSHLLVVNSVKEFTAVKSIWEKNRNFTDTQFKNYIHVGLRKGADGTFVSVSGVPLNKTGYILWDNNEPNNLGGNESCMSITYPGGGLNDVSCGVKLGFICEQEL